MADKVIRVSGAGCDEVRVIGSGRNAYLWLGCEGKWRCHFSGSKTLAKLAEAIRQAQKPKQKASRP